MNKVRHTVTIGEEIHDSTGQAYLIGYALIACKAIKIPKEL